MIVLIMRNHSGVPFTHYKFDVEDPKLEWALGHCGIDGSIDEVKAALEDGKSFQRGSGYWACKGTELSEVDF